MTMFAFSDLHIIEDEIAEKGYQGLLSEAKERLQHNQIDVYLAN
jgi:hypothetical protein